MNLISVIFAWMLVILLAFLAVALGCMGEIVKCVGCAVASLIMSGRAMRIGEECADRKDKAQLLKHPNQ